MLFNVFFFFFLYLCLFLPSFYAIFLRLNEWMRFCNPPFLSFVINKDFGCSKENNATNAGDDWKSGQKPGMRYLLFVLKTHCCSFL